MPGWARVRAGVGWVASRSSAHRNAARVLPEPVGAWIRVLRPAAIAAHPRACASVGASKLASNHVANGPRERGQGIDAGGDGRGHGTVSIGAAVVLDQMFYFEA